MDFLKFKKNKKILFYCESAYNLILSFFQKYLHNNLFISIITILTIYLFLDS